MIFDICWTLGGQVMDVHLTLKLNDEVQRPSKVLTFCKRPKLLSDLMPTIGSAFILGSKIYDPEGSRGWSNLILCINQSLIDRTACYFRIGRRIFLNLLRCFRTTIIRLLRLITCFKIDFFAELIDANMNVQYSISRTRHITYVNSVQIKVSLS